MADRVDRGRGASRAEVVYRSLGMLDADMVHRIGTFIVLLLSLSVHEWAHAISAFRLGDDTAARMGRLTLNPISHIDPIGTLLLPLVLGVPFGWAKPVPVNFAGFRRDISMGKGMAITAGAGPLSNVVLAILAVLAMGVAIRFFPAVWQREPALSFLLSMAFQINVLLAVFNMLPVPPLDGSRIVDGLLPFQLRPAWERFVRFSPIVLIGILVLPWLTNISLLSGPLSLANRAGGELVGFIVGLGR